MGYIKDNYQTTSQFFKDVKNGINDIGLRLDDLESRREDILGGGLVQEEEDGKEYKAGEGILITDDDSVVLNYNGPFAYHLDHIDTTTTTTLWVTRSVGYVVRNGVRQTVYANTTPAAMASGESAWMLYNTDADSYSISIQTNAPTATSNKICVKLAENVNGVLRQIQFGEVVATKIESTPPTPAGNSAFYITTTGTPADPIELAVNSDNFIYVIQKEDDLTFYSASTIKDVYPDLEIDDGGYIVLKLPQATSRCSFKVVDFCYRATILDTYGVGIVDINNTIATDTTGPYFVKGYHYNSYPLDYVGSTVVFIYEPDGVRAKVGWDDDMYIAKWLCYRL